MSLIEENLVGVQDEEDPVVDDVIHTLSEALQARSEREDEFPPAATEGGFVQLAGNIIVAAMAYDEDPEMWTESAERVVRGDEEALEALQAPEILDFVLFFAGEGPMPDEYWEAQRGGASVMELSFQQIQRLLGPEETTAVEDRIEELEEKSELIDVLEVDKAAETLVVQMAPEAEEKMATAIAKDVVDGAASTGPVDLVSGETVGVPVDSGLDFQTAVLYAKGQGANRTVNQLEMLRSTFIKDPGREMLLLRRHLYDQLAYPVVRRLEEEPSAQERAQI